MCPVSQEEEEEEKSLFVTITHLCRDSGLCGTSEGLKRLSDGDEVFSSRNACTPTCRFVIKKKIK